jgi:spermidine/putrescine transport system permease protein
MESLNPRWRRLSSTVLWIYVVLVIVVLYLPMIPPPLFSLSDRGIGEALRSPSFDAYAAIWRTPILVSAMRTSLIVALCVGLITPVLAVLAARAVRELGVPRAVLLVILTPLFIPGVSMGLATAFFLQVLGLSPSLLSICAVHVLWALPFATLIVLTVMAGFDAVYLEAAYLLGANRWRGFFDVELPLIRSGILGAATFSMILSFNETVRTALVQGPLNTLQTYIWSTYRQVGLSATLYGLMSLLITVTLLLVAVFWVVETIREPT